MTIPAISNPAARVISQADVLGTIEAARTFRGERVATQFAATALPEVVECMTALSGVSPDAVAELAMTVGALRALPELTVPSLVEVLKFHYETCPQVVIAVAGALKEYGSDAKAALVPLRRAMAYLSDDAEVLVAASKAIIAIDPAQADDTFVKECAEEGARRVAEKVRLDALADRALAHLRDVVDEGMIIETNLPLPPELEKYRRRPGSSDSTCS